MGRYIDADALIIALRLEYPVMPFFKENRKEWDVKTEGYRKAEEVIKDAPSIDIVRCKECKWHSYYTDDECRWRIEEIPKADDFCSYGEREEE